MRQNKAGHSVPTHRTLTAFFVAAFMLLQQLLIISPTAIHATVPIVAMASPNIVISQVYGGGGASSGSPAYTNDYVELFNTSDSSVSIGGWSLQYGSSTGNFASTASNLYVFPAGTSIGAGKYLTVKLGSAGTLGGAFTSDLTTTGLSMAAGSGKVALANINAALGCGATATPCALPDARIVDLVSYGASNNAEGDSPVNNGTGLNSSQGAIRKNDGCQDTDNNLNDFVVSTTATGLVPRTSNSPANFCDTAVNQPPVIIAPVNPITTVNQDSPTFTVSLSGSDDNSIYNWSATAGAGVASVTVSGGQGTANATYNVSLQTSFSGTATFTATLSDGVNAAVNRTVNIAVTPSTPDNPPTIGAFSNPVTTVAQDAAPFDLSFSGADDNNIFIWSATAGTGVSAVTVRAGQGTSNVTYIVTLQTGFSGSASFTASLSDGVNAPVNSNVAINVTPAPPPPLDHVVISQVYGGGGNSGATFQNDFVELFNPDTVSHDLSGWTIQYASATGTSWQIQPLGGVIASGEYYLIKLATNGAVGAVVPDANINGSLNLSGSAGKVALVRNGDPLEGCVVSDSVVDLVGYGTTANCREGVSNAPTLTNTTAAIRKNGGFTDTNVNGADFTAGTPNPRRTSPIVELPPTTLTSDPRRNGFNAPRDASITVTFTEPVDIADGWFSIDCVATGSHNDATVASGGANSWIIIPNVNFQSGEQCTLIVNKEFVRDSDLDDSLPNTDQLTSNYSATFTVATGVAPAYTADVHLAFGNPSGATADINEPNNYLMEKPEFTLSYNRDKGTANWVSWHLADEWIGTLQRFDTFRADPAVPADWYRVTHVDYSDSGFDRGHMVPNADRDPETSTPINQATFLMTNMIPQSPDNNQGPWAAQENYLRTLLPDNEVYIVAGGGGGGGTGSNGFANTIANGKVTVPAYTWKVAVVIPKDSGDDVSRVSCTTRTIAVIMPNIQGIRNINWQSYITTVDAVEQATGYDFFSNLPDHIETCVEAGRDGVNPPAAESQTVSTDEDVQRSIVLSASAANNNPLNYEVISQPLHGTLTGTGSNRVYTPAPDYFGTDSFTFKVNDGVNDSATAMVSIVVNAVNDAPVLSFIGNKTVFLGGTLSFTATASDVDNPASELTFSLNGNVPAGAAINPTPGAFSWTPNVAQAGEIHTFTVKVTDAGGLSDEEQIQVGAAYEWSNLLAPFDVNDTSLFKADSGIPVKFRLTGASSGVTDATAKLWLAKVTSGIAGTEFAATSAGTSNMGNLFRYDAQSGQYIYNLSTKDLPVGVYQLRVDLGDGVNRTVLMNLR